MTYSVKEIFYTVQGEGANAGRVAVFCRFTGCNLWSGREIHRSRAICQFCDTEFVGTDGDGGGKFQTAAEVADRVECIWNEGGGGAQQKFIVCTGGEPLLQLDKALTAALHDRGFFIAVETNGTKLAPSGIDWLTVSPKANTELLIKSGNELKLVYPQKGAPPEHYTGLDFDHFYLQPMAGDATEENTVSVIEYCKTHPQWRVGVQSHKVWGIA